MHPLPHRPRSAVLADCALLRHHHPVAVIRWFAAKRNQEEFIDSSFAARCRGFGLQQIQALLPGIVAIGGDRVAQLFVAEHAERRHKVRVIGREHGIPHGRRQVPDLSSPLCQGVLTVPEFVLVVVVLVLAVVEWILLTTEIRPFVRIVFVFLLGDRLGLAAGLGFPLQLALHRQLGREFRQLLQLGFDGQQRRPGMLAQWRIFIGAGAMQHRGRRVFITFDRDLVAACAAHGGLGQRFGKVFQPHLALLPILFAAVTPRRWKPQLVPRNGKAHPIGT